MAMTATTTDADIIIRPSDRAAWLEERRRGIGASEAAAALGLSPYESPRGLYLRKVGLLPEVEETEAMRIGTLMEPVIAQLYQETTGNLIVRHQVFRRHPDAPHLSATIDGLSAAGYPVEFKAIGHWTARALGEEDTDQVPEHWLVQAHQQMFVMGCERVDFGVLVAGQEFRTFTVPRDEGLIEAMLPRLGEFWGRVGRREPPAEFLPVDARIMHVLYPGCEGEVALTEEDAREVDAWEDCRRASAEADEAKKAHRAKILERLGNHAVGHLPDGRVLTRKVVQVKERTQKIRAYSYPGLWVRAPKGG
jgi:putative phage-type endonuclease